MTSMSFSPSRPHQPEPHQRPWPQPRPQSGPQPRPHPRPQSQHARTEEVLSPPFYADDPPQSLPDLSFLVAPAKSSEAAPSELFSRYGWPATAARALVLAAAIWFNGAVSLASFAPHANRRPVLQDIIHMRVSDASGNSNGLVASWVPDYILLAHVAFLALGGAAFVGARACLRVLCELMTLLAISQVMRGTTVAATELPSPLPECRGLDHDELPPANGRLIAAYCNDLMFSGHTVTNVLLTGAWLCSPTPLWARIPVAATTAVAGFISAAAKDHYTMDVLVGAYIAGLLVYAWREQLAAAWTGGGGGGGGGDDGGCGNGVVEQRGRGRENGHEKGD